MKLLTSAFLFLVVLSCSKNNNATSEIPVVPTIPPPIMCTTATKAMAEDISIFPADNPWNTAIATAAIDGRSTAIIALLAIGNPSVKADFGSGLWNNVPIGIPYTTVCDDQPLLPVVYRANGYDGNYGDESDPGPFPIPLTAPIEGNGTGGDNHVIVVDVAHKKLYELYNANKTTNSWQASSGAKFDLNSNVLRPDGWTSADAAGLPIFPGLVRYEEILKGEIDHPIRFTLRRSKVSPYYIHPATHKVNGTNTSTGNPTPFGMRIKLKQGFNISGFSTTNKIILTAMKKYGLILADIGSDFYISGAPDERWDNDDLRLLGQVSATDFEVVQIGSMY